MLSLYAAAPLLFVTCLAAPQVVRIGSGIKRQTCREREFRCSLGTDSKGNVIYGCISKYYLCDGIEHCYDKSDESKEQCSKIEESCTVPKNADGTNYNLRDCAGCSSSKAVVNVQCEPGFVIPFSTNFSAEFECPSDKWDRRRSQCMRCGQAVEYSSIKRVGTFKTQPRKHPWRVAIFKNENGRFKNVCGGTLITTKIVLTAASCIFNEDFQTAKASLYEVFAGKIGPDFYKNEINAQRKGVEELIIPKSYNGEITNYNQNIGLMKLNGNFIINEFIQIACIYSNTRNAHRDYPENALLTVTGWGLRNQVLKNVLMESNFETIPLKQCRRMAPGITYIRFFSYDKFCLSLVAGTNDIQQSDTGSGTMVSIDGINYIYGIVSVKNPEYKKFALVTNVTRHEQWIRSVVDLWSREEKCPETSFSCSIGGCVSKDVLCNGNEDCEDASDEDKQICNLKDKNQGQLGSVCVLPDFSKGTKFRLDGCKTEDCNLLPGSIIPDKSIVKVVCDEGYKIEDHGSLSGCLNSKFLPELSKCSKLCPPLVSDSLDIKCFYKGDEVSCHEGSFPSTRAVYDCKNEFRKRDPSYFRGDNYCQSSGTWRDVLPLCEPICGKTVANGVPLISNGKSAQAGQFPWHIGLYKNDDKKRDQYQQICGGSLITPSIIVTAAHCVSGEGKGRVLPVDRFIVAAGKYFRDLGVNEPVSQIRSVKNIKVGDIYSGSDTNYQDDIALLQVSKNFKLDNYVLPICVDWTAKDNPENGLRGKVYGWGCTRETGCSGDGLSVHLMESTMPYVDSKTCLEKAMKTKYERLITIGKFCATYTNDSGVQSGDSGGGYVIEKDGLYYLYGVVSTKPWGVNSFALFTNVHTLSYSQWIRDGIDMFNSHENILKINSNKR